MPEEVMMNYEAIGIMEDPNPENEIAKKFDSDIVKDSASYEIEKNIEMVERSELVTTETLGSNLIESSFEASQTIKESIMDENEVNQISSESCGNDIKVDIMTRLLTEDVSIEESDLKQEVTKTAHQTEVIESEQFENNEESTETCVVTKDKSKFSSNCSMNEAGRMTKTLSKQSISRQTMQERFNETTLEPYKASYTPLLTMKRKKKYTFEEKTPELILIEQLLNVHDEPKVEEQHLESKEDKIVDSQAPTHSKIETNNNPPLTISNKSSVQDGKATTATENNSNFVSFRKSCCVIS